MASLVQRGNRYCVVYQYTNENGERKQKWETYKTASEAKRRKKEIEYKEEVGTFTIPKCKSLDDLLKEYVALYGKATWAMSTYSSNVGLIDHYISPIIGHMKLNEITTRVIEKYYQQLLKTKPVDPIIGKKKNEFLTPHTVRSIHKLLHSCFEQAVKWELMEKNPTDYASVPKAEYKKRDIWTAETLFQALELCEDERLKLCLNLAFACSLRMGELPGLTWDCVEISDEAIAEGKAYIQVNKELQRVSRDTLKKLDSKDVMLVFPPMSSRTTTVQVLKAPKTSSSVRKIFLPRTVAEMLIRWKEQQMETIEALGDEYQDFDLVIAGPLGMPTEAGTINASFRTLIEKNDLPRVVFHSLRHSSITYKLKLNGGDVKAVQGDSGHAQVKMVTDVYSHILDDDRRNNARLFEEAFYSRAGKDPTKLDPEPQQEAASAADVTPDTATLLKLLQNPEMAALLKTLAKSL